MKQQTIVVLTSLLLVAILGTDQAAALSIGVFSSTTPGQADCTKCSAASPCPFAPFELYVLAPEVELSGAEFKVTGMPSEWFTIIAPAPTSALSIGDEVPLGPGGGEICWDTCAPAPPNVLLFTITVIPTTTQADVTLQVTSRNPPGNPNFNCPVITMCDTPVFSKLCTVTGGSFIVNPTNPGWTCDDLSSGVPSDDVVSNHLTLERIWPNPAKKDLVVSFSLPRDEPARLELFDVSGRRVLQRAVGSVGRRQYVLPLVGDAELPAGIYVLRLVQGDESVSTKVTLVR